MTHISKAGIETVRNIAKAEDASTVASGERVDEIGFGCLRIIQLPRDFCYGIDAVILADFAAKVANGKTASQKSKIERVMDIGTGTGIVPLILSHKTEIPKIFGLEIQSGSFERAIRGVRLNGLDERIEIICSDVSKLLINDKRAFKGSFDMVVSNPPYVAMGGGINSVKESKHIARQETSATLDDFINTGAQLLRDKGHFVMVHRPGRLGELIYSMKNHGIEPKTLRFVSPMEGKPPNIVLIHGIKNGGSELKVMTNLIVYEAPSEYSKEVRNIYER